MNSELEQYEVTALATASSSWVASTVVGTDEADGGAGGMLSWVVEYEGGKKGFSEAPSSGTRATCLRHLVSFASAIRGWRSKHTLGRHQRSFDAELQLCFGSPVELLVDS